ncbi:hypothetical protein QBC46DRAFT_401352 [Diplogelasinospora grovesii]|uniref:Uncharacterized protein n=1 Tax=Diplogelasinospora grovesii TaxID=303347 RepID=A0AAN6MXK1_9PEZI|nr:hypothetical protein QBC46DRAFT_401352 [Diplogelasinospora grovesii]
MANDPSRWSHSDGEGREIQERIDASNRLSDYSGVEEEATFGVNRNATDLAIVVSSGQEAKDRRGRERKEREREEREREERERQERERQERERQEREREEREREERERQERERQENE